MANVKQSLKVTALATKIALFFTLILFSACGGNTQQLAQVVDKQRDLVDIVASGKLVAVSDFNSTSYFVYKGEPMGYQYDLLRDFASYLGVKLELIAENDIDKAQAMLERGEVD